MLSDEAQPLLSSSENAMQNLEDDSELTIGDEDSINEEKHDDDRSNLPGDDASPLEEANVLERSSSAEDPLPGTHNNGLTTRSPFEVARAINADRAQLLAQQARDAASNAVSRIKKLGLIRIAKEVGRWINSHPAETAAIVVFVVVMACTPAILTAVGFTTGGIAAGMLNNTSPSSNITDELVASTAAAIQSGIGSVVAGSAFAICQSAMMGGYGAFILFALPLLSSAIAWASTKAWKYFNRKGIENGGEAETGGVEGEEPSPPTQPSPDSMTGVRETLSVVGEAMKLGAILAVGTSVYRYRRWRRSRERRDV